MSMQDFDIHEFAKMFDAALASDNPSVQKSLRNFMMVAAIAESDIERDRGPFQQLFERLDSLEQEHHRLKQKLEHVIYEQDYKKSRRNTYVGEPYDWSSYPYSTTSATKDGWDSADKEYMYKMLKGAINK